MQQLEELITGAEVARRLGISRQRVGQLRESPPPGFPAPAGKVGQAVVWRANEIDEFARGVRNLITINGYAISRDQAVELAARLGRVALRDKASGKAETMINRALRDSRPVVVAGAQLVAVYQALEKWLDDVGIDVFGPQLLSLRYGLDVNLENSKVRENFAAAFPDRVSD